MYYLYFDSKKWSKLFQKQHMKLAYFIMLTIPFFDCFVNSLNLELSNLNAIIAHR